jgi:hypothetical protein
MVELFHTIGIFIHKKCVGLMKSSKVLFIVLFALFFQNCKTKRIASNKSEICFNNNICYNNSLNYNSNIYNKKNKSDNSSDSCNKLRQVKFEYSLKSVSGLTTISEKKEYKKIVVKSQKENENIKTGPIKTLRKIVVIIASLLLIAAFFLLLFSLIKWQSIFLLWSSISSGISYLLFKIGKKRLKTDWIEADRKQLKKLKKSALIVGLISGFIYIITLVF